MKRILASIVTTILIVAMTLVAMFTLVRTTVYVTSIPSPSLKGIPFSSLGMALYTGYVFKGLVGRPWALRLLAAGFSLTAMILLFWAFLRTGDRRAFVGSDPAWTGAESTVSSGRPSAEESFLSPVTA